MGTDLWTEKLSNYVPRFHTEGWGGGYWDFPHPDRVPPQPQKFENDVIIASRIPSIQHNNKVKHNKCIIAESGVFCS